MGKKPLYYAHDGADLLFGSEIKTLMAVAPHLAKVDAAALNSYFRFGYVQQPRSIFRGIRKLPAGHLLHYRGGSSRLVEYWRIPPFCTLPMRDDEEALTRLEELLTDAVKVRLISEVPLGAFLSGGVDSSIIVGLMSRLMSKPVDTFSIRFDDAEFDESVYAEKVAARFGADHHPMVVHPELAEVLDVTTRSLEEPFADSSMVPTYYVSKLARSHVTVALTGDAGDELFAGYKRYAVHLSRGYADRIPAGLKRFFRSQVYPSLPGGFPGRRFLYNLSLSSNQRYLDSISLLGRENSIFTKDFLVAMHSEESPLASIEAMAAEGAPDSLAQLQHIDMAGYLEGDILVKVDRMTMLNSLEARVPLLDHHVVEFANSLPSRFKIRDGEQKFLLRRLAERIGVPHEVIHRPKRGFAMPLKNWFRDQMQRDYIPILTEPQTIQRGYFQRAAIEGLVREHLSGRRDRSAELWQLLVFELWHRNYLGPLSQRQPATRSGVLV